MIANAYAILHDPSVYSDPEAFNPDRYLPTSEGGLGEPLPVGQFGFGRRYFPFFFLFSCVFLFIQNKAYKMGDSVCLGQYLASASIWIVTATKLATFKISKALDDEGNEITPAPKMTSGLER